VGKPPSTIAMRTAPERTLSKIKVKTTVAGKTRRSSDRCWLRGTAAGATQASEADHIRLDVWPGSLNLSYALAKN
jgi:hypothetical protein